MKFLFFGDPHLDSQNPISRLDDYRQLTLNKLNQLLEISIKNKVDVLVSVGDMFHRYDVPLSYLVEVLDIFAKFKENNIEVYSIIGNHDLDRDNIKFFYRMPLNLLFSSGLVNHLNKVSYEDVDLYGLDFTEEITKFDSNEFDKEKTNILIMHYATDNTVSGDSISRKYLTDFDIVVSGHDHQYFKPSGENPLMLRPGSLTRRTKDEYNLTRDIIYYIYDSKASKLTEGKLDTKPAEEVFKNDVFANSSIFSESIIDFTDAFNELYEETEVNSVYDILDVLRESFVINEKTYKTILDYLTSRGAAKSTENVL